MAARRMGLYGASDSEREARLTQQRDYAAQLQEQVRLKNARAEEEKARRRQEQQAERELLDASRHQHAPPSPPKSPLRKPNELQPSQQEEPPLPPVELQAPHGTVMLGSSPRKQPDLQDLTWNGLPATTTEAPKNATTTAFISTTETSAFENQIEALQKTRQEIENAWKQRRITTQADVTTRLSFILPRSPSARSRVAFGVNDKQEPRGEIEVGGLPEEESERPLSASSSGLGGESVLIPLPQPLSLPPESQSGEHMITFSRSPPRASAAHRRLAAAVAAAASNESPLVETSVFQHESQHLFK